MDKYQSIISKSPEETAYLGQTLAASVKRAESGGGLPLGSRFFCLYGDLGSGKTTFVQGFAKGLGIFTRLLSPTFIIVRRYGLPESDGFLYHLDLYRLHQSHKLQDIGIDEILNDDQSYVVIEWAEKLGDLKPSKRTDISFVLTDEGHHRVDIEVHI